MFAATAEKALQSPGAALLIKDLRKSYGNKEVLHDMIRALAEDGTAVIVTTHGLDEAEYCNRLGIMCAGEMLIEGTPSELRESEQCDTLEEAFIKLVGRRGER